MGAFGQSSASSSIIFTLTVYGQCRPTNRNATDGTSLAAQWCHRARARYMRMGIYMHIFNIRNYSKKTNFGYIDIYINAAHYTAIVDGKVRCDRLLMFSVAPSGDITEKTPIHP